MRRLDATLRNRASSSCCTRGPIAIAASKTARAIRSSVAKSSNMTAMVRPTSSISRTFASALIRPKRCGCRSAEAKLMRSRPEADRRAAAGPQRDQRLVSVVDVVEAVAQFALQRFEEIDQGGEYRRQVESIEQRQYGLVIDRLDGRFDQLAGIELAQLVEHRLPRLVERGDLGRGDQRRKRQAGQRLREGRVEFVGEARRVD